MTTLLVLSLLLGGTDTLNKVTINTLSFKAPTEWAMASESESGKEWVAPMEGAKLAIDVFPVDPQRPSKACVKQLVEAVAKDGFDKFETTEVGGHPAAKRVMTDYVGEGEGEEVKKDDNKVTTTMILGCNGRTKWVLTWTAKTSEGARFVTIAWGNASPITVSSRG